MWPLRASNSQQSFHPSFPSTEIRDMYHHAWLGDFKLYFSNQITLLGYKMNLLIAYLRTQVHFTTD